MIKKIVTLMMAVLVCGIAVAQSNNPVVQIVGYDAVGGLYPNMVGWGSASIISKDGLILTNNHVVDNGLGSTLPGFSICITVDDTQRPKCLYTARLVARDIRRDIALLRIDPVDIFGNNVDFANLTTIELDYDYVPKAQDVVVAIGYPWVGANTITKTQGVVAGTQPYNDVMYIKTDALIAGGNSGGPLVLNNKVIGINTFGMGDSFDPSLGYALSVAEIKEFIEVHKTKSVLPVSSSLGFSEYLRNLQTINTNRRVSDDFISMKFEASYQVTHYIPQLQLRGEISNPDIYHVQQFNIQRINVPRFKDKKQQEYFLKNQMQLYGGGGRWTEKLKTRMIGGLEFYEPIYEADPSGGEGYGYKRYFTVVDGTMVIIALYAPLGDANTQDQVKANIDSFLSTISFGSLSQLPRQEFKLAQPSVHIPVTDTSVVDLFGQLGWGFSEYYGWSSNYVRYLDNLYETISFSLSPNTIGAGKGKTPQQLLDADIAAGGSTILAKGLVSYYGNNGYMVCRQPYWSEIVDELGRNRTMAECTMNIIVGLRKEYIATLKLFVLSTALESRKSELFEFVDMVMRQLGDPTKGVTVADTLRLQQQGDIFTDLSDQDPAFQKFARQLATWGALKNRPLFDGDYALLWQDFVPLYLKLVYNKSMNDVWSGTQTYADVVARLPYNPKSFVPVNQISYFQLMLSVMLAGVSYHDFSEYGLHRFERLQDSIYQRERSQIQEWEYSIYGSRRIDLYEAFGSVGYWVSDYQVLYNPVTLQLTKIPLASRDRIQLSLGVPMQQIVSQQMMASCYSSSQTMLSTDCLRMWQDQVSAYASYAVLTKGDAITMLSSMIDVGLFESYWAQKKQTQVDDSMIVTE